MGTLEREFNKKKKCIPQSNHGSLTITSSLMGLKIVVKKESTTFPFWKNMLTLLEYHSETQVSQFTQWCISGL